MDAPSNSTDLDQLLAHSTWVRALARTLVRDPALADDVAQDAWVAALEHPPRDARNLRGWLAQIVRNAARQRGRSEGARARREAATPERPAPHTPEELVGRVELHRELSTLVTTLAEPGRSTLVLRYYEGLTSAEIARRQDVPAGTVRWRLKQAVDELRARLDERHGGERSAWLPAFVALAGELPSSPVPAGLSGVWLALRALAAAALVLGVGFLGWRALAPDDGEARGANAPSLATNATTVPEASDRSVESASPGAMDERDRAVALAEGGGLQLRVVDDANGESVPGARVLLFDAEGWDEERMRRLDSELFFDPLRFFETLSVERRCDETGSLELEWSGVGGAVLASSGGAYAQSALEPGRSGALTLRLVRAPHVRVVDAGGHAQQGVPVNVLVGLPGGDLSRVLTRATSGADSLAPLPFLGELQVDGATPRVVARLGVIGHASAEVELDPTDAPYEPYVLRIGPTAPVEVRTVDAKGAPLDLEAEVELVVPGRSFSGAQPTQRASLRGGRARFETVGLGIELEARLQLPALGAIWTARSVGAKTAGELLVIEVVAPERPMLSGRALDADGRPLRSLGLHLALTGPDGALLARPRLETDSEGRFRAELGEKAAAAERIRVTLLRYEAGGWRLRADVPTPVTPAPVDLDLGDLRLLPTETRIAGRVVDGAGAPVAGLEISVPQDLERSTFHTTTDEEGRFDFDCLLHESFDVTVADEEWVATTPTRARPGDLELELVVARGGSVAGSLIPGPEFDGSLVMLLVEPHESHPLYGRKWRRLGDHDRTDGSFVAAGLPAGRYRCRLMRHGATLVEVGDLAVALGEEVRPAQLQAVELGALVDSIVLLVRSREAGREIRRPMASAVHGADVLATEFGRDGVVSLPIVGVQPTHLVVSARGHRPRVLAEFESGMEVVLEPGLTLRLSGDRQLELERGERRASLSLRLEGGDPRWPRSAREVPLHPNLAGGEAVPAVLPGPGRYVLCASVSQPAGDGMRMASADEALGEPFVIEVREGDAGRLLVLPLPASVLD